MKRNKPIKQVKEAQMEAFMHDELVVKLRWLATLDSHTCIGCGARDGKTWTNDADHTPIGHSIPFRAPPLHRNCRCALVPVTKTYRELGLDVDQPRTTRASSSGQVPADTTFSEWFKRQPPSEQDEKFGLEKTRLFRKGILELEQMLDEQGKVMTLAELKAKYKC